MKNLPNIFFKDNPWGTWELIDDGPNYKVKKLAVFPNKRISLQYHNNRSEFWVIVSGKGIVQLGGKTLEVSVGSHVEIEKRMLHRISNTGKTNLEVIEIQVGECSEDDIIRVENDYGRK